MKVKETNKMNFSFIPKETRIVPAFNERKVAGKDYVSYGDNNLFPQYLWQLYLKSAVLQSIVNGTADFVAGNKILHHVGISYIADNISKDSHIDIEDLILKISLDYFIFGGFALEIQYNKLNEIRYINWLDFQNVRSNEDGDEFYYCENWKHCRAEEIQKFKAFDPNNRTGNCIYYFKGNKSRGVYPIPTYIGALTAVETSTEISKFHLNNILNNLQTSAIISFNNGQPDEDTQAKIEQKIKEKFSGADNAGKFILVFNDNKDQAVSVLRLTEDKFDEKYQALSKSTMQEIFIAFRAQPQLFGYVIEGAVFNKQEFSEAYELYNRNVVAPMQKQLVRIFDTIFGIEKSIEFVPYSLTEGQDIKPETTTEEGTEPNE